jgi:hypothetical protein
MSGSLPNLTAEVPWSWDLDLSSLPEPPLQADKLQVHSQLHHDSISRHQLLSYCLVIPVGGQHDRRRNSDVQEALNIGNPAFPNTLILSNTDYCLLVDWPSLLFLQLTSTSPLPPGKCSLCSLHPNYHNMLCWPPHKSCHFALCLWLGPHFALYQAHISSQELGSSMRKTFIASRSFLLLVQHRVKGGTKL